MEGVTAKIVNAVITKNIEERAAYETSHTVITQKASGFCPPKINGDAFVNSFKNLSNSFTCFEDSAAGVFNMASSFFSTMEHLDTLLNLSVLDNPITTIAKIFLSRFVTSFTYSNIETKVTIDIKDPHQSKLDIEVLRVNNDRTHLEGVYNIKDKGIIETGHFETEAPEREYHSHSETHGYSISLNPVSLACACIEPSVLAVGAALPNISVFNVDQDVRKKENYAQVLNADDLFIRCDDAIFSGSKIQARLVEAIVAGDLTIEDLTNEFISETHNSSFSINLGGIFSLIHNISVGNENSPQQEIQNEFLKTFAGELKNSVIGETFLNPAWSAIPHIRIADEKTITREVQNLSALIGREKFYLKVAGCLHKKSALVGLVPPDGVVVNSENEKIEAGRILDEKIAETHHHEKHVINPCIAEFVGMMSAFASLQKNDQMIEAKRKEIENFEKNKALNEGYIEEIAKKKGEKKGKEFKEKIDKLNKKCEKLDEMVEEFSEEKRKDDERNDAANKSSATTAASNTTAKPPSTSPNASASTKGTPKTLNSGSSNNSAKSSTPPNASASSNENQHAMTTETQNLSNQHVNAENSGQTINKPTNTSNKSNYELKEFSKEYELHSRIPTPRECVKDWMPKDKGEKIAKCIVELWYDLNDFADEYPVASNILNKALYLIDKALFVASFGWKTIFMAGVDWLVDKAIDNLSQYVSPDEIIRNEVATAVKGFKDKILMAANIGGFAVNVAKGQPCKVTLLDPEHIKSNLHPSIKSVTGIDFEINFFLLLLLLLLPNLTQNLQLKIFQKVSLNLMLMKQVIFIS